jgi:hypothetical protein
LWPFAVKAVGKGRIMGYELPHKTRVPTPLLSSNVRSGHPESLVTCAHMWGRRHLWENLPSVRNQAFKTWVSHMARLYQGRSDVYRY